MYYSLENNVPYIQNTDTANISGRGLSYVVGQYGCAYVPHLKSNPQELLSWKDSIGFYKNDVVSIFDYYNFSSSLTFYPDNEELLFIHNPEMTVVDISFYNTIPAFKRLSPEEQNFYDDLWVDISSPYTVNPYYQKDIRQSHNFEFFGKDNYKQPRTNTRFKHKLVPRHPLNTKDNLNKDNVYGIFLPDQFEKKLQEFQKDDVARSDVLMATILQGLQKDFTNKISLGNNQILILDQLTTQFKISKGDVSQLNIHPLWYKTTVRKNFHYSI